MARRKVPALRPPDTVDSMGAAALLGVSRATFFRYRQESDFPQPVQVGRGTRPTLYRQADIIEWKRRRETAAQ